MYMDKRECHVRWIVYVYHLTWAGFTLLILIWGQCEGLTTGISAERNFTPTSFFVSIGLAVFQ